MKNIIEKIYHGFNNSYDLKNKFYDYLTKELRNEPNKLDLLNQLISEVELEYINHQKDCKILDKNCEYFNCKENAVKIIKAKIKEIEKEEAYKPTINIDNSTNKNVVSDSIGVIINQNSNNHINSENKENWFKKNIKLVYYTGGVIAGCYAFYKWLLPLF